RPAGRTIREPEDLPDVKERSQKPGVLLLIDSFPRMEGGDEETGCNPQSVLLWGFFILRRRR
ncbi:MAG TPA: hypothetical protein VK448_07500, partial [Dissulfurispiraceae bacterium]|nr:hypothetical protein [Dissulfurispiraceae bacterium]